MLSSNGSHFDVEQLGKRCLYFRTLRTRWWRPKNAPWTAACSRASATGSWWSCLASWRRPLCCTGSPTYRTSTWVTWINSLLPAPSSAQDHQHTELQHELPELTLGSTMPSLCCTESPTYRTLTRVVWINSLLPAPSQDHQHTELQRELSELTSTLCLLLYHFP